MDIDLSKLSQSEIQTLYRILDNPILWSEAFLKNPEDETPFKVNCVQKKIIGSKAQKTVIRVHRRAGKSYGLTVYALWYALTHKAAKILIVCPDLNKVQALFNTIDDFLRVSEDISGDLIESAKSPAFRKKFKNGSIIMGFTAGSSSKAGAKGLRGQTADVVIIDEAAFLAKEDWTAIEPIMQGDARRPNVISFVSSTPLADRNRYWELATRMKNGWSKVHVPVTENPDYSESRRDQIRAEVNDFVWQQEWLAEFPDVGEGVYKRSYIDRAQRDYEYYDLNHLDRIPTGKIRTMGVDWDKYQGTGPNILILELDRENGVFKAVYHEEIEPTKYCLTVATQRIIKLNEIFNPQWIYVDRGFGETNVEHLHLYGEHNPESGLATKVKGYQFKQSVEIRDPATKEIIKEPIKPVMVNITVKWMEDARFIYPASHQKFTEQLQDYRVIGVTNANIRYSEENEHIIDAFCLAAYAMQSNYNDPFGYVKANTSYLLPVPEVVQTTIIGRDGKPKAYGVTVPESGIKKNNFGRRRIPDAASTRPASMPGSIRRSF